MDLLAPSSSEELLEPESEAPELVAPDMEELLTPESEAPELVVPASGEVLVPELVAPLSEEVLAPESEPPELVAPETQEVLAPESEAPELVAPESQEVLAPESEELLAPDSSLSDLETTVPDTLPPATFLCPHCHLVHEDRESWNRAHSRLWPCARCGLMHMDYWIRSTSHSIDEFDCAAALDVKRGLELAGSMNNKM
ncbi:hypothetical protein ACP4OV_012526 [Aristida adscensionis]